LQLAFSGKLCLPWRWERHYFPKRWITFNFFSGWLCSPWRWQLHFAETLDKFQHSTLLIPESRSFTVKYCVV
jgi:hypothetical protein